MNGRKGTISCLVSYTYIRGKCYMIRSRDVPSLHDRSAFSLPRVKPLGGGELVQKALIRSAIVQLLFVFAQLRFHVRDLCLEALDLGDLVLFGLELDLRPA